MRNRCATRKSTTSTETQKLVHQRFEDLRNRTKSCSNQTKKIMSQLNDEGIEILNSQMDRQAVVVWICCHSQTALQYIQKLYESNHLKDVLCVLANISPEIMQSKVINLHSNQFRKTVVVCPSSFSLTEIIDAGRDERVCGVTKLRNEIYVVCASSSDAPSVICVYEDRNPFRLHRKIEIKEIKGPFDIGSSETENCLYISDIREYCIWKITREADDQHKIIKWLETRDKYVHWNFSVSRDNHILLLSTVSPCCLMIFGSDAKLIRSIPLPRNIVQPSQAVQTSTGNFIIIHNSIEEQSDAEEEEDSDDDYNKEDDDEEKEGDEHEDMDEKKEQLNDRGAYIEEKEVKKGKEAECMKEKKYECEEENESGSRERKPMEDEEEEEEEKENLGERRSSEGNKKEDWGIGEVTKGNKYDWCISEVTRDGKMVIRRFIPLNEKQKLIITLRLALDSDDRVFVADWGNNSVVLLDSYLKWNRTIREIKKENDEEEDIDITFLQPEYLYYDEEKAQLIVSGSNQRGVHVYTFSQI